MEADISRFLFFVSCLILTAIPSISFPFIKESDLRLETGVAGISLEEQEHRLRENHFGEEWREGVNFQTALWSRFSLGERLDLVLEPVLITPRDGRDVYFRRGYLRLTLFNAELTVGRDALWWGPGRHGALLVSNNAFPFDLLRLRTASSFSLPGPFARLGRFEIDGFLTRLEQNRDFPRPKLFGLRLVYHPRNEIAIGASRTTLFGGEGRPGLTLRDFGRLYFSRPNRSEKFEVNELLSLDLQIEIPIDRIWPGHSVALYGEYGGEDESNFLPTKIGILGGLEWRYDRHRFIIEYADNHVPGFPDVWYHHAHYTAGHTYRGEMIGHHMGSDADDLYFRLSSPLGPKWTGGLDLERERRRLSDPAPERMLRGGADLTYSPSARQTYLFRLIYEKIVRPELSTGDAKNLSAVLLSSWEF